MSRSVMLEYLSALEQNNNRDWFHANKGWYRQANAEFEALVGEIIPLLQEFDGSIPLLESKALTFKQQRDTRFCHDKSPYNPSFRAHIAPKGKLPIPVGYYLMLRPGGQSFLGGGLFADMFQNATAMVRDSIASSPEEWERIVTAPDFTAHFTVGGTKLRNVPRGYDPGHPQAESLKHKSWYLEYPVSDKQTADTGFAAYASTVFARMQPFQAFLNRALEGFEMPTR